MDDGDKFASDLFMIPAGSRSNGTPNPIETRQGHVATQEDEPLLGSPGPDSWEVVRYIPEGLTNHLSVPATAEHGHLDGDPRKKSDKVIQSSGAGIREPLTVGSRQQVAERFTSHCKTFYQTSPPATDKRARIAIKAKKRIFFIDAADLIAVEAKGNYVLLLRSSSSHMLRGAISNLEEKLDLHGFVRIHRSVLVNAALVEEIHPLPTGEYALRVRGGRKFTVTRTYKKNLQLLAHLWFGMENLAPE